MRKILGDNIGVNFHMELSDSVLQDEAAYMLFTLPGGNQKIYVKDVKNSSQVINGKTYYPFACEVAAKEMTDTIQAQMFCSDGNGSEKSGTVYSYTVKDYAEELISRKDSTTQEIALAKALLNYGAYAQEYFDYNLQNLANAKCPDKDLTVNVSELATYLPEITSPQTNAGITYISSSILLETEVKLRHYFEVAAGITVPDGLTPYKEGTNYYYYESQGIPAASLGTVIEYSQGGYTISYSPLSYATTVIANSNEDLTKDTELQNVLKAMYLYYLSVLEYNKA